MKPIAAALPIAVAAAGLLAPAVSSAAGTPPAANTQTPKMQLHGHDGLCPFAASRADV
ncbi:MAG TPA: hypothetical protein VK278_09055 [Gaiellaceae bacterium]|nr:hypothetical protein [Gaiellaceae bacterium]